MLSRAGIDTFSCRRLTSSSMFESGFPEVLELVLCDALGSAMPFIAFCVVRNDTACSEIRATSTDPHDSH